MRPSTLLLAGIPSAVMGAPLLFDGDDTGAHHPHSCLFQTDVNDSQCFRLSHACGLFGTNDTCYYPTNLDGPAYEKAEEAQAEKFQAAYDQKHPISSDYHYDGPGTSLIVDTPLPTISTSIFPYNLPVHTATADTDDSVVTITSSPTKKTSGAVGSLVGALGSVLLHDNSDTDEATMTSIATPSANASGAGPMVTVSSTQTASGASKSLMQAIGSVLPRADPGTDEATVTVVTSAAPPQQSTEVAADDAQALLNALNVTMSPRHMALLPANAPEFKPAASEIVRAVNGRQMRHLPLEIRVSPGHMHLVDDTIKRLANLKLEGTHKDHIEIYFIWVDFLEGLTGPPKESDFVIRDHDELWDNWHDLYQAYYMARVKSAKIAIASGEKQDNFISGGTISKDYKIWYTKWTIRGQHLDVVENSNSPADVISDQIHGGRNDEHRHHSGKGLKKTMKHCGAITDWHFSSGADAIFECPKESQEPKESEKHSPDPFGMSGGKKGSGRSGFSLWGPSEESSKKHGDERSGISPFNVPRLDDALPTLLDMGSDINAHEPLPPEQDDSEMGWWNSVGGSRCRPQREQAAAPGEYNRIYGTEISHRPRWERCEAMEQRTDVPAISKCGKASMPQHNIVKVNGIDHLHINFYAWHRNANTRIKQLVADKYREGQGAFVARFNLPDGAQHCVKDKLRDMGWTGDISVINKTNWAVFAFEIVALAVTVAAMAAAPVMVGVGAAAGAAELAGGAAERAAEGAAAGAAAGVGEGVAEGVGEGVAAGVGEGAAAGAAAEGVLADVPLGSAEMAEAYGFGAEEALQAEGYAGPALAEDAAGAEGAALREGAGAAQTGSMGGLTEEEANVVKEVAQKGAGARAQAAAKEVEELWKKTWSDEWFGKIGPVNSEAKALEVGKLMAEKVAKAAKMWGEGII